MLWLPFALIALNVPQDNAVRPSFVRLQMDFAGVVNIPETFSAGLNYNILDDRRLMVTSEDENGAFFRFVFIPSKNPEQAYREELARLGLDPNAFSRVKQSVDTKDIYTDLFFVSREGGEEDMLAVGDRSSENVAVFFFLLTPRRSFYQYTPDFTQAVQTYYIDPLRLDAAGTRIGPFDVAMALGLLVANIFLIWIGFREIARSSNEG